MSSSPTAPSSTTSSSSSSRSDAAIALIACGALAQPAAEIVERRGWSVAVHPLPPLLHNQPHLIADEVRGLATALSLRAEQRRRADDQRGPAAVCLIHGGGAARSA